MKMIVIVGESASGKSTLQSVLTKKYNLKRVITYTTRPPRENEINGVDYNFISKEEFESKINEGFFAEYTMYRGWYYGTAIDCCGKDDTVAVLNPQGMRSLKKLDFDFISFYLCVDRRSRLIKILQRGDDIEEAYRRNLTDVGQFIGIENEVDYTITNDDYKYNSSELAKMLIDICITNKQPKIMWKVNMVIDDSEYVYGIYNDNKTANEIAIWVRSNRKIDTYVEKIKM